jgi:TatA/E family protein of Tat protein translocase
MFGSLGLPELLTIFVVALVVFGPRRLPEIGRTLGKALGEFKKATEELKNTIEKEVSIEEHRKNAPIEVATPAQSVSRGGPVTLAAVPRLDETHHDDVHHDVVLRESHDAELHPDELPATSRPD